MRKAIRQIIFTYVILMFLTAGANAPESLHTVEYNTVGTQETHEEGELYVSEMEAEEDLQHNEISLTADSSSLTLVETERMKELEEKLNSAKTLTAQITSTYSEENTDIENQISELLEEVKEQLEQNPIYTEAFQEDYNAVSEELEQYKQMLQSIMEKMETIKISTDTDMSQMFGFTEEEFLYILKNVRGKRGNLMIEDSAMAENVAKGIIKVMEEYPVNEI